MLPKTHLKLRALYYCCQLSYIAQLSYTHPDDNTGVVLGAMTMVTEPAPSRSLPDTPNFSLRHLVRLRLKFDSEQNTKMLDSCRGGRGSQTCDRASWLQS